MPHFDEQLRDSMIGEKAVRLAGQYWGLEKRARGMHRKGYDLCLVTESKDVIAVIEEGFASHERAVLMSAGPDMLGALNECLLSFLAMPEFKESWPVMRVTRLAIKKATAGYPQTP